MFGFIKNKLKKIYETVTTKVSSLFSRNNVDNAFFGELETLLISADAGVTLTKKLISQIKDKKPQNGQEAKEILKKELLDILINKTSVAQPILLLVGVNGTGKTSFAAKYANKLKQEGKKVLLVAGDTFRAAATTQLQEWGKKLGIVVYVGRDEQDPSSVIFDASTKFINEKFDNLIIDTAGRLQTKSNLMKELEKIRSIISRKFPAKEFCVWLTVDAMLGQNSLTQAKVFNESTKLTGIVLTKLDGTGKGGILFAIAHELKLPIKFISFGESKDDISEFDSDKFVNELLG